MLDLSSLNPQQRQAVETINGPVLILAGAGTGKTRVITFRIAHMIRAAASRRTTSWPSPSPTRPPAKCRNASSKLLPPHPELGTRNSRNRRPPHHLHLSLALRPHPPPAHRKARLQTQLRHLRRIRTTRRDQENPREHFGQGREDRSRPPILSLLSRFKNGGERAAVFGDPNVRALAEHVAKRYESALHACNAVDFDDLILLTLRLFHEHPDALEACRAKYRYVMVDEYQDTNAAQFQLVHLLTEKHRNLCVVGDDDQSIYGWRGAEIANLLDLEKHFPEVKVVKLEQNYRSTNTILNAANALIKNNVRRRAKHSGRRKATGTKIALRAYETDEDEAREVVAGIEFARLARRVPWAQNAILFRTNLQSRAARNRAAHGGRSLSPHRRAKLLRPPRSPRPARLSQDVPEPARRRQPAAHRQHARPRPERRDDGAIARRKPRAQAIRLLRHEKSGGDDDVSSAYAREH